jgi:hypothetical protein
MHVPIDDQHALDPVSCSRVVRTDCDVAEETEPHRSRAQGVVAWGTHGAEAPRGSAVQCHVDGVEDASSAGRRGVPRPGADDRVGIETAATAFDHRMHAIHVLRFVSERQLGSRGVSSFDVHERVKELGPFPQSAWNRAESSDVFRMSPAGVMPATVGVGYERDRQGERARGYGLA